MGPDYPSRIQIMRRVLGIGAPITVTLFKAGGLHFDMVCLRWNKASGSFR
jgi:hypothetical protein